MTVTPVEFEWREWRLGEGRYRGRGPASKPRPAAFPRLIPPAWWARLVLFLARRKKPPAPPAPSVYGGPLLRQGEVLRNPGGGVEDIAEMVRAGVRLLLLNLNQGDWTHPAPAYSWDTIRQRAAALQVDCVPWKRAYTLDDVRDLVITARAWGSRAIAVNLEDEAKTTLPPVTVAGELARLGWNRETITFTVCWLYNDVDWQPLAKLGPALLEFFPSDTDDALDIPGCEQHAHDAGYAHVYRCFGTYRSRPGRPPQTPASYPLQTKPYQLFTGDDVGPGNHKRWQP